MGLLKIELGALGVLLLPVVWKLLDTEACKGTGGTYDQVFGSPLPDGHNMRPSILLMQAPAPLLLGIAVINLLSLMMGSTARLKVGVLNLISFGGLGWLFKGHPPGMTLLAVAGALAVGLVIHMFEPGIFTKDKGSKKKA